MSLRSARPVDDSLSELAEQMALDEPSTARDNGETCPLRHTLSYITPTTGNNESPIRHLNTTL